MVLILLLLITSCLFDMSAFNCLHPTFITNSRGELKKVRCGRCAACTNSKSFDYTTQCELESAAHKYTFFVTLTYSNEHLPLVRPFPDKLGNFILYKPVSPALFEHFIDSEKPYFALSHEKALRRTSLSLYYKKFNLPEHLNGLIPVLDKVDLQLFIKRLRYYIGKQTHEKIRYFACGEYGPVHFRPHYHLLLWCDKAETAEIMGQSVSSSWKYGRVDTQVTSSTASSYVAGYVNGLVNRSRLHDVKGFRPFVLHSTRLFGSFYTAEEENIPYTEFDDIARATFSVRGRFRELSPLRSFLSAYFPKCINYDSQCHSQRLECYLFSRRVETAFGFISAEILGEYLFNHPEHPFSLLVSSFTYDGRFNVETVKNIVYTSRKFLRLCDKFAVSPDFFLRRIEHFYDRQNYFLLTCQLSDQEEKMNTYGKEFAPYLLGYYDIEFEHLKYDPEEEDSPLPIYYGDTVSNFLRQLGLEPQFITSDVFDYRNSPSFADFSRFQRTIARDKIKHKIQNDLNNIFTKN